MKKRGQMKRTADCGSDKDAQAVASNAVHRGAKHLDANGFLRSKRANRAGARDTLARTKMRRMVPYRQQ